MNSGKGAILCSNSRVSRGALCRVNAATEPKVGTKTQTEGPSTGGESGGRPPKQADVVVIGSGIGGLSAAAMASLYGLKVVVLEGHSLAGGAAHAFERGPYTFDSGPSLFGSLDNWPSTNPLTQVLHAVGERVPILQYTEWECHLPQGHFTTIIGNADKFRDQLVAIGGPGARADWDNLMKLIPDLAAAATAVPSIAIRQDVGNVLTIGSAVAKNISKFQGINPTTIGPKLFQPFSKTMEDAGMDPQGFVWQYFDLIAFLLSGQPASNTMTAEIAFMFSEWFQPDSKLDYPVGGTGAIIDALIRGIEKYGGQVYKNCLVERVTVDNEKASGVRYKYTAPSGEKESGFIRANEAVISNATVWDTLKMVPENTAWQENIPDDWKESVNKIGTLPSFMHLHIGFDMTGLDDLNIHHIVVPSWDDIEAPQNVSLISIPSALDPENRSSKKKNFGTLHAYHPATEPFEIWDGLKRSSQKYKDLKEERSKVLFEACERVIPDLKDRIDIKMVGSPLTHKRYLNRHKGTYGGYNWGYSSPATETPLKGLHLVGDSLFPGPGVPAVAATGALAANSIVSAWKHLGLLLKEF